MMYLSLAFLWHLIFVQTSDNVIFWGGIKWDIFDSFQLGREKQQQPGWQVFLTLDGTKGKKPFHPNGIAQRFVAAKPYFLIPLFAFYKRDFPQFVFLYSSFQPIAHLNEMVLKREFLVNRYFIYIALPPHYLLIFWFSLSDGKIQITILIPRRGALPKCICNKFRLLGKDSCVVVLLLIKLSIQKFWDYGIQVCKRVNMTNLGLQIILTWFRIFVEYIFVSCVFFWPRSGEQTSYFGRNFQPSRFLGCHRKNYKVSFPHKSYFRRHPLWY